MCVQDAGRRREAAKGELVFGVFIYRELTSADEKKRRYSCIREEHARTAGTPQQPSVFAASALCVCGEVWAMESSCAQIEVFQL